ncbi:MAG: hypothetical protein ABMA64_35525 [Myxococcota bacterium]
MIDDRPPVLLSGPFTVRTAWSHPQLGRKSTLLVQVVVHEGDSLSTPPPWREGLYTVGAVEAVYKLGGSRFLVELVDAMDRADRP